MGSALFIVWRESIEAVLIVGILYAYLARFAEGRRGIKYLFVGVAGGVVASLLLALAAVLIQEELSSRQLAYFETGAVLLAAVLMAQMVLWMARHAAKLTSELHADMDKAMGSGSLLGVGLIAMVAVMREGSETVLYLYGLGLENTAGALPLFGSAALGFVLALVTAWAVSKGVRYLNYRLFFRVTGVLLLFSAAGLLVSGVSNLIAMGTLPALMEPVWNTSAILDSGSHFGGVVASFTGYRSQPSLMLVLSYALFWGVILIFMKKRPSKKV